jgi:hypothetical protein
MIRGHVGSSRVVCRCFGLARCHYRRESDATIPTGAESAIARLHAGVRVISRTPSEPGAVEPDDRPLMPCEQVGRCRLTGLQSRQPAPAGRRRWVRLSPSPMPEERRQKGRPSAGVLPARDRRQCRVANARFTGNSAWVKKIKSATLFVRASLLQAIRQLSPAKTQGSRHRGGFDQRSCAS